MTGYRGTERLNGVAAPFSYPNIANVRVAEKLFPTLINPNWPIFWMVVNRLPDNQETPNSECGPQGSPGLGS